MDQRVFEEPENCTTVWKLFKEYGISKQKTGRAIRAGKLNAIMADDGEYVLLKWYIKKDEQLEKYIKDNAVVIN